MKRTAIIAAAGIALLTACTTPRETSSAERERIEHIAERMDSMLRVQRVNTQDSSWREFVMRELRSIREKSDTSHTLVVDTAGNVIRERLIIRTEREQTSDVERLEREVLMHRLEVMDSMLTAVQQQVSHSDSLLRAKTQTVEVPRDLTWWQRTKMNMGISFMALIAVIIAWGLYKLWRKFRPI